MSHAVTEIFYTLQGEGRQAGGVEPPLRDRLSPPHRRRGLQTREIRGIA